MELYFYVALDNLIMPDLMETEDEISSDKYLSHSGNLFKMFCIMIRMSHCPIALPI